MKHLSIVVLVALLVACGSTSSGAVSLGGSCSAGSACAAGLSCYAKGDETSLCTRDCDASSPCGAGFVCVETDIGNVGDASHVRKSICAHTCSNAGRGECGGVWTCNVGKGACEPS